ncbi:MAG: hypothetical protein HQL33_03530 [Alphaproteobacteria bacterium]|nr:hypothetical protein [Alphaproteobacteria bacterium]
MATNKAPVVQSSKLLTVTPGGTSALGIVPPVDPDGDALTIRVTSVPSKGALFLDGKPIVLGQVLTSAQLASLTFKSPSATPGMSGYFAYQVSDGKGGVARQTVGLYTAPAAAKVAVPPPPVNHAPLAQANKAVLLQPGKQAALGIAAPTDVDGDKLTITITSLPAKGAVLAGGVPVKIGQVLTAAQLAGLTVLAPPAVSGGIGAFGYSVSDGKGGAASQIVALSVAPAAVAPKPANHAPVAQADKAVSIALGGQGVLGIAAPTDVDGDALSIKITGLPAKGAITLNGKAVTVGQTLTVPELKTLAYQAPAQQGQNLALGNAGMFSYQVSDGKGGVAQQNVSLNLTAPLPPPPLNHAPIVGPGATNVGLWMNTTAPLKIQAPVDQDGDAMTITVSSLPVYGAVRRADGTAVKAGDILTSAQLTSLIYQPVIGMSGQGGQFVYTVKDSKGATAKQSIGMVVWQTPIGENVANPVPVFDVARQSFVAKPGALFNLGELFQPKEGVALPAALTITSLDVNRYAGVETNNYGTLTARTGEVIPAGTSLSFALVDGRYVKTGLGGSAGLTLEDFTFSASTQEDRVQSFEITAYDLNGKALDNRSVSINTSSTWVDPTPGVATAAEMVQIAQSYVGKAWDANGCWNLVQNYAVKAGASLSVDSWSLNQKNAGANGQWTVAYDGTKGINANWMSALQAGDVVEFAWKNNCVSGHIAMVSRLSGGQTFVIDNGGALVAGSEAGDRLVAETALNKANINDSTVIVYRLGGPSPLVANLSPTVQANYNCNVQLGQSVTAGSLFKASDVDNDAITAYKVRDNSDGGGYFTLGGVRQAEGQWISVDAASLANLGYTAGAARGTDSLDITAYDGHSWSSVIGGRVVSLGSQTADDTTTGAAKLGTLTADGVLRATDVLSRNDIHDFYSFTLASAADVVLTLGGLAADCAIDLYSGLPGAGRISGDHMFGANAKTVTASLAAGTYFVDASYATGGPQTNASNYDLAIAFAQNAAAALGALASNALLPVTPMAPAVVAGAAQQTQPGMLVSSS